jgi:glycine/D-amino acid oxidase-like deaminating enzyme
MVDFLPDALPVIDRTTLSDLILATGMKGHGFGIAPGIGKVMAHLAPGRIPRQGLTTFRYGRFKEGISQKRDSVLRAQS